MQEDGEPWQGLLVGKEGNTTFPLVRDKQPVSSELVFQWYKMPSGKYEINAYLS